MRPRRSSRGARAAGRVFPVRRAITAWCGAAILTATCALAPRAATAQRGVSREAALFLVLPLGARAVASGQSVASADPGVEQLYWNPGGIARAAKKEIALSTGGFYIGPMLSVASVIPMGRAGVVGGTVSMLDYGSQETGDASGVTGVETQRSYILAATYAATFGKHVNFGFGFESAHFVGTCSGICGSLGAFHVSSSAINVGAQYRFVRDDDVIVAIALRHAGLNFQVNDEPQSDPLPTRLQIGVSYRVRAIEKSVPESQLRVFADVIDRAQSPGNAAPRFGAEISWREQVRARAGFVAGSGEGTGLGVGLGLSKGRGIVDISQTIGGTGDANQSATYLTLRYQW